jgi:hypothetical protein
LFKRLDAADQLPVARALAGHARGSWRRRRTLLRLGDHAAAANAAAEASHKAAPTEPIHFYGAGVLARCVPLAQQDKALAADERDALAQNYGDQAIALLRQSLHSKPRPTAEQLRTDPYLAPLRARADFRKLVQEFE